MGNGGCSQLITAPLCSSFLLTFLPFCILHRLQSFRVNLLQCALLSAGQCSLRAYSPALMWGPQQAAGKYLFHHGPLNLQQANLLQHLGHLLPLPLLRPWDLQDSFSHMYFLCPHRLRILFFLKCVFSEVPPVLMTGSAAPWGGSMLDLVGPSHVCLGAAPNFSGHLLHLPHCQHLHTYI